MSIKVFDKKNSIDLSKKGLEFNCIKSFFDDKTTVIQVSNKNKINYELIKKTLPSVKDRPNIYGIYEKENNHIWQLRYIGQRKHGSILTRLNQHLYKEHKSTGSKFKEVKEALDNGNEIGIKLFSIRPDSMRLYYEERLISEFEELKWNQQKHKIKNR